MRRIGEKVSKRAFIRIVIALLLIVGCVLGWRVLFPRPAKAKVATAVAKQGEFIVSLVSEGTLQSDNSIVVRTGKAPGELTMIVPDGTIVRAGDIFCRIESRELLRKQTDAELASKQANEEIERARENAEERYETDKRQVEQTQKDYQVWEDSTRIRIKQAEDQLAFDRAEAERLKMEAERSQRMASKGYKAAAEAEVTKAAYDAQEFKVEQSAKDLELNKRQIASERRQKQNQAAAAERRVGISQNRISWMVSHAKDRAEVAAKELQTVILALADTNITAPVSGTVSLFTTFQGGERRSWREGDQVSSGTPLGSISGSENMSVRCRIRESNIAALQKGQEAEIVFDALSGRKFRGVVASVGTVAREVWLGEDPTAQVNERVFDVLVKVNKTQADGLKPGLNARASIILKRLPDAIYIPLEAVFEEKGKSFAFVKQGADFAHREIQTGERNDTAVVVTAGVYDGDIVALSDPTLSAKPAARKAQ